ncbi:hypothetical protein CDAR_491741 [Caerostris darwini]|uniref:PPM-type phosphatase domain-containing protein n=1 Tax=Caerostris darwini TaxID=1538125 RepID=A0AAV4N249_9ARAC|nr:hypothetical protein CDAR_491741 [Caerostris darwini]
MAFLARGHKEDFKVLTMELGVDAVSIMKVIELIKEYRNELQSSTPNDLVHPKIVGNYTLNRTDVSNQIIDWALHYLETRKCPYQLAVAIAKNTAQQIDANILEHSQENGNSDQEKLLNSFTLYTETIKKLPEVCSSFMEEMKENEICSSSCSLQYTASVFAIKNKRRKMEDRHVIHPDLNLLLDLKGLPAHSYYAVFDGHSGVDAASYASAHLHVNISKHPAFMTDTVTAITDAYKITDENFLKKCHEENLRSGSTAVCALIREKTVYLSWVGDSQAVLVKEGKPAIVTDPHKPERLDERKRIEDLGGEVTCNTGISRVNGILAVTRALGDPDHKRYISGEPEITTINLDGTEDFLILACDGLWDGMSPEDVTSALYYNISGSAPDEPLDTVAAKLVHQSKLQGSEDNITAVVVLLRDIKQIKEYATKLLPQTFAQNFLEMNGGEEECGSEEISNSPCAKPTVLELSAASAKKLKNAANVLSSAGITDPSYACSYTETAVENVAFHKVQSDAISVPHPKVTSCLAPEATALSELPTPPIDDVLASQQFESLNSADIVQDLNSLLLEPSKPILVESSNICNELLTSIGDPQSLADISNQSQVHAQNSPHSLIENEIMFSAENGKFKDSNITPEEAVDIASSVVSNTIETAVKQISFSERHETISPVSTSKLNPYAEPFVMKSFIVDDDQLQTENKITSAVNQFKCDTQNKCENIAEVPIKRSEDVNDCDPFKTNITDLLCTSNINDLELEDVTKVLENTITNVCENPETTVVNSDTQSGTREIADAHFDELNIGNVSSENTSQGSSNFIELPSDCPDKCRPYINQSFEDSELNKNIVEDTGLEKELPISNENPCKMTEVNLHAIEPEILLDVTDCKNTVSPTKPMPDVALPLNDLSLKQGNSDETLKDLSDQLNNENVDVGCIPTTPKNTSEVDNVLTDEVLNVSESGAALKDSPEEKNLLLDQLKEDTLILNNIPAISNIVPGITDQASNAAKILNDILTSPKNSAEINNSALLDQLNDVPSSLKSISSDPQSILNTSAELVTTTAALSADAVDDCPVETLTVDLQALPDGIPEAEGVTEDIDSDSEKDGGWSYMKGHTVGSGKSKSKESTKTGKQSSKPDSNVKTKKEISKSIPDNKSKLKVSTALDKTKKPLPEKKALDLKDKSRTKVVSSTLPKASVEKSAKITTTVTSIKKEIPVSTAGKVASVSTLTKTTKTSTIRNVSSQSKTAPLPFSERNQSSSLKPVSSSAVTGNVKPKSATTSTSKPSTKSFSSFPSSKGPVSTQSNKPNVASTTRTTTLNRATTVPSKTLTKSSTLTKPIAAESNTKPMSTTMRKTVPPVTKKPDVKETKDIVNKQISARKNVLNHRDTLKSAPIPAKNAVAMSNKPVPGKSSTAPVKEVPKPAVPKFPVKSNMRSKISQNAAVGKDKKTLPLKEKSKLEDKSVDESNQSAPEITPVCEEEKFILEVNDKEVIVKEQNEVVVNSVPKLGTDDNIIIDDKALTSEGQD